MIIIVPAVEKGRGGGHLSRCIKLVKDLRIKDREALLYLAPEADVNEIKKFLKTMDFNSDWLFNQNSTDQIEAVILDRFQTPLNEILFWKNIAPLIGIDEGGSCRDKFDFLIDILIPKNFIKPFANITSPELLFSANPENHLETFQNKKIKTGSFKILIAFGHEDSAGLGTKTAKLLLKLKKNKKLNIDITLIKGALSEKNENLKLDNVNIVDVIQDLASRLHEYDLVITHYGITAYEARFAGTHVLLDHPTNYHKKLAKTAGFISFSIKKLTAELHKKNKSIASENTYNQLFEKKQKIQSAPLNISLAELINGFSPMINKRCPVCGAEKGISISRFSDRTYRLCANCDIIYMDRINQMPFEYDKDYFYESYIKQYGKTYLDDFENIKNTGKRRLKLITEILQRYAKTRKDNKDKTLPSLLDIGCAYGPFLAAAKEEGYSPFGIDPVKDAVSYVQNKLNIPAVHGFFPIPHIESNTAGSYNVITMWYVIEHFTDCITVLDEVKKLLKKGGVFAFSTPSFSGISGRSSPARFLKSSPADHFTVWRPKMCKKALASYGLKLKKIVSAGHHPERFPVLGKFAVNKNSLMYKTLYAISCLFRLGDTFEVYGIKQL